LITVVWGFFNPDWLLAGYRVGKLLKLNLGRYIFMM
jgi:hypothetical protein